jgi:DNA-binding NtrC family response regulator
MMSDELMLGARHFQGMLPPGAPGASCAPGTPGAAQGAAPAGAAGPTADEVLRPLPQQIAELERRAIAAALVHTGGNKVATAKLLRISRAALYEKLALYGL